MRVHHARHTVEPEAVKHVDVHVETQIGQKETKHLVMTIIEETRVPELMPTTGSFVKVLVVRSIKVVDPES